MTRLHLVRHAAHAQLGQVLTGRTPGVSLSETGRAQAQALAATLGERPIASVVASPRERARETAAPLAAALGLPVTIEPDLDEIDFGDWTGRPFAELAGDPVWEDWNRSRGLARCPGGETMLQAQARAIASIDRLAERQGEFVIVGHQDVLKSVVMHWLGMPLDLMHRIALDPAHRCTVEWSAASVVVQGVNLPP